MDVEAVLARIGFCGRAQRLYCLVILVNQFVLAFQMIFMVFAGANVPFVCEPPTKFAINNRTSLIKKEVYSILPPNATAMCNLFNSGKCGSVSFRPTVPAMTTVASEWLLICKHAYKISSIQSLFMFGVLVGSLMFGYISDQIGRKKTTLICFLIVLVSSTVSASAGGLLTFAIARLVAGFGIAGFGIATFVLGSELVGGNYRAYFGVSVSVFFALGIAILSIIAQIYPDWRSYGNAVSLVTVLVGIGLIKVPESPRWLVSQGRLPEAKSILGQIARANGRINVFSEALASDVSKKPISKKAITIMDNQGFSAVFSNWLLLKWTLIQVYSWLANSCVYYGLTMAAGNLSPNLYQNVALSGLAEWPGYLLLGLMLNRGKRRVMLVVAMVTGGTLCTLIMFVSSGDDLVLLRNILALTGKTAISISFAIVYIHSAEIYPTVFRNTALGVCSMFARLGGMLAPFVTLMGSFAPGLEYLIFGFLGLTAGLCNMALPETLGRQLPETVSDMLDTFDNTVPGTKLHKVQASEGAPPSQFC